MQLTIATYRKKFAIFAGESRLASGFANEAAAQADLEENREMYTYWAGSAGVSVQNTPASGVQL